jgi:hypothetical protein
MKALIALFAVTALASLIGVSIWATGHVSIVPAIADLVGQPARAFNPWFAATLTDAYFAFLWFWLWIASKERSNGVRLVWLILVLALGNMAMAAYALIQLRKLPPDATLEDFLLRQPRAGR